MPFESVLFQLLYDRVDSLLWTKEPMRPTLAEYLYQQNVYPVGGMLRCLDAICLFYFCDARG